MKSLKFSHRFLYLLLGSLAVLLGACTSQAASGTTTGTRTSPTATVSPTSTASSPKLTVAIICQGTKQNGYGVDVIHGKVCAQTLPGATLTIQVSYCGKPDLSNALQGSTTADANGFHQWNWTPQPDCNGQPIWAWQVKVTAQLNDQTANANYQGIMDGP